MKIFVIAGFLFVSALGFADEGHFGTIERATGFYAALNGQKCEIGIREKTAEAVVFSITTFSPSQDPQAFMHKAKVKDHLYLPSEAEEFEERGPISTDEKSRLWTRNVYGLRFNADGSLKFYERYLERTLDRMHSKTIGYLCISK